MLAGVDTLPLLVTGAVLASAVIHAGWNAVAKFVPGRLVASALIGTGFTVFGAVWVVFAPLPAPESWPYLVVSAALQSGYLLLLTAAYSHGEFRQVYPLARGTAPILVAAVAITALGEQLDAWQLAGVALVVAALGMLVSLQQPSIQPSIQPANQPANQPASHRERSTAPPRTTPPTRAPQQVGHTTAPRRPSTAVWLAIATGVVIASYSLVDGIGVRQSGTPAGYASWQFAIHGPLLIIVCGFLARRRKARLAVTLRAIAPRVVVLGIIGGLASGAAYAIVLWAQSQASLAMVSALRETSVLFAGIIGTLVFSERFTARQMIAAVMVVAGIVLMQIG